MSVKKDFIQVCNKTKVNQLQPLSLEVKRSYTWDDFSLEQPHFHVIFFFKLGIYHITPSLSLDAKVTGLMRKVILIGHNLLENNIYVSAFYIQYNTKDSCNLEKSVKCWFVLVFFTLYFSLPSPAPPTPQFVQLVIICASTAPLFPSHHSFRKSQVYTAGNQALILRMFHSFRTSFSSHTKNPRFSQSCNCFFAQTSSEAGSRRHKITDTYSIPPGLSVRCCQNLVLDSLSFTEAAMF